MSINDANGNLHSDSDGRFTEKVGTRPGGSITQASRKSRAPRLSMRCAVCGFRATIDFINMADTCPGCKASPFPETDEDDD